MRNKFIPLAVALVFGSVAAVGFTKMMKASPQAETIEIFVAVRDINVAEELTQESIRLAQWPAAAVPRDAIQDWKKMEGKFAAQRLFADEPVVLRKLMDSKDSKTVDIPKGFNVVTLKTDEASSVANLVSPGDRVNVIAFFTKSDVIPATTTRTVLSGVKVFAVDGRTTRNSPDGEEEAQAARTVSLLIHAGDAEAWTCAKEMGKISLSLGRPDDGASESAAADGPNPAGQQFLQWLAAHQEAKAVKNAPPEPVISIAAPPASPAPAPAPEPAAAKPNQPEIAHRMVKIGPDGRMSVYTWIEGNPIPQITAGELTANTEPAAENSENSLDYLHGPESPLYGDPSGNPADDAYIPAGSEVDPGGRRSRSLFEPTS